ncbi:MAG: urate hydroxylase PuuD [Xanthomonadales bacterium]|nr:urate hydroxylase PuuD [Xanthomonadales bacterium]
MEAHLHMWLSLLVRWSHFIVGVAWIGASFYFNWLENHLQRQNQPEGTAGDLWAVHGGGFYYLKKFAVTPGELPPSLHWFKWEAYTTWLSGMALLIIVFYWNAQTYMLDPQVSGITPATAIAIGILSLLSSWIVYDLLCCSDLSRHEGLLAGLVLAWFILLAWTLSTWLSGRAAYIHVGAAVGTIMVANVFRVIIPAQKDLVNAVTEARTPDASKGRMALQRSRHNNYFTLPVLFIMISSHYPATYNHSQNWLVLLVFSLAAVAIRHYFNIRHLPGFRAWPLLPALLLLAGLIIITAPKPAAVGQAGDSIRTVQTSEAFAIVEQRCTGCHARVPSFEGFTIAPLGIELDSPLKLEQHADRVYQSVVVTRVMPLANLTQMTDSERSLVARWFEGLDDPGHP